ncbi:hypothetical protein, partial [Candidatus Borrarchaeum sp.]|uniref:hypothetical protein n=1 Tax=Candidatus Borrarchaeum sp. TaxID=2846742 RepID=UPI00257AE008
MGSFWNKVVFKFGSSKIKVKHIGILFILGLVVYYFNAPLQFSMIRGTTVSAELGSLKSTRNIANSA